MILYELKIPARRPDGTDFCLYTHATFYAHVLGIAGGLTVLPEVHGQWRDLTGCLTIEPMIPVQVACTPAQISQLADYAATHFEQKAIMYHLVSDRVTIKNYECQKEEGV